MVARLVIVLFLLVAGAIAWAQSAAEKAEAARQLLLAGRTEEAISQYRALVAGAPDNPELLLNLAIAEHRGTHYSDSIRHAEEAARLRPDLYAAYLFIGAGYLQRGDAGKAVAPLEKCLAGMPGDRNARLMLAEALLAAGRYDDALEHFRRSAELLPDNARVWYGLGQTYDALADRAAASLQSESPSSAAALAAAGDTDARRGRFGRAFTALQKALEIDPSLPGVHDALARIYRETGHADWAVEAEAAGRKAASAAQTNRAYGAYLAYREDAAEVYAKLDRLPPSLEQHLHRAKSLDLEGRYTEAIVEWREVVKLAPGDPRYQIGLAWSLFRRRDYDSVISTLQDLLREDAQSVQANFLTGAALLNLDRPEAALPYLRTAAERDAAFLPAQAALGQAMLRTGDAVDAIPHLVAAIPSDEDGTVRFQLSRAYSKNGQEQQAREALSDYQAFRAARDEAIAREQRVRITRLGGH